MDAPVVVRQGPVGTGGYTIPRPKLESRRQIPALTGLRFFAAFFILFAHACDWIGQFQDSNVGQYFSFVALYGMPLFFVLSGFVIHYNYRDLFMRAGLARAICEFAAARFARLYPLYFCFLLVAIGADDFVLNNYNNPRLAEHVLAYFLTLTHSWWYLVYNGKLIINQLFPPSWSISTEMYFYLSYAGLIFVLLAVFRLNRAIVSGTVYTVVIFGLLWLVRFYVTPLLNLAEHYLPDYIGMGENGANFEQSFYRWLFYFSPYVRVLEFFLGCFVAQAIIERTDKPVSKREYRIASFAIWAALAVLALVGPLYLAAFNLPLVNMYTQFFALNFLCAPAIAVIMFCLARYDNMPFTRLMSLPLLVALGETSYSIYLVHAWTLRIFEHPAQPFTAFWAGYAALRVVLAIVFTLLVSYGTYRLIELPGRVHVRGMLRRLIVWKFGQSDMQAAPARPSQSKDVWWGGIGVLTKPVGYTTAVVLTLTFIAVAGQAMRYGTVRRHLRQIFIADMSEITIISADYGLRSHLRCLVVCSR